MSILRSFLLTCAVLVLLSSKLSGQDPKLVLPIGHSYPIAYAKFSSDGKYIVTASEDGTAKLWRVADAKLLRDLDGHSAYLEQAFFSSDGSRIVTVSGDNTFRIWETRSGKCLHIIKGLTKEEDLGNGGIFITAKMSPDMKYLVTFSAADLDIGHINVWDMKTGKRVRSFPTGKNFLIYPGFSKDSRYVGYDSVGWEIATGKPIRNFAPAPGLKMRQEDNTDSYANRDESLEAVYIKDRTELDINTVKIRNARTAQWLSQLDRKFGDVRYMEFSPDNRHVLTAGDKNLEIWDVSTGKLWRSLFDHTEPLAEAYFSLDGRSILTYSYADDTSAIAWDLNTGATVNPNSLRPYRTWSDVSRSDDTSPIVTIRPDGSEISINKKGSLAKGYFDIAEISPDEKYIATAEGTWQTVAYIWEAATGKLLKTLRGHTGVVHSVKFSPNGKYLLTAASDETSIIWNLSNGAILHRLPAHSIGSGSANFSPDGKWIVTTAQDNTVRIWNTASGKLITTFFMLDSAEQFMQVPAGYYYCTPGAARLLHYVTSNMDVISFEQLDVRYNRPDKVLEAIGSRDSLLIQAYRNAYKKRIRKLGIDTTGFKQGFDVPYSGMGNSDSLQYEQRSELVRFRFYGGDSIYFLDRFNVWINDVPLFSSNGISIRQQRLHYFDTTISLQLSPGQNRVVSTVTNVNGTESYRMPLELYSTARMDSAKIYFAGIGIDQYQDSTQNLRYSVKDIRDLAEGFKKIYGDRLVIDTLFNQQVTKARISELKKKFLQTSVQDKLVLAYSGHGILNKEFDYYLSSWPIDFDHPENEGIPYELLENLLDSIPARQKLMLIDACHSGEVDKDDIVAINMTADSMKLQKGLKPVAYKDEGRLGLKNSFELMQSLFVNVGKSTGATVISAASGTQFALERDDLANGVFSYSILEAMKHYPSMSIEALKKYVSHRVSELTNGRQQPTSRNENVSVDWRVW